MNNHSQAPPTCTGSTANNNHNIYPNPYVHTSAVRSSSFGNRPMVKMVDALSRCGKKVKVVTRKAEAMADNVWHHLRTSPSLTDAALARLAQGTKVLAEGGHDKVFQQEFDILPGEKLLNSYACYLSTSSGPVIGTLYLSTKRVAFCSDYPLCYYPSPGRPEWMYYKIILPLDQLGGVNPSANRWDPSDKYIQIVTRDGHEFWFQGFLSYDKALKNLTETFQRFGDSSVEISRV